MKPRAAVAGGALLGAIALALLAWLTPAPATCSETAAGDDVAFFGALALGLAAVVFAVIALRRLVRERRAPDATVWNVLAFVLAVATFCVSFLAVVASLDLCFEI